MKRFYILMLSAIMSLSLIGCGNQIGEEAALADSSQVDAVENISSEEELLDLEKVESEPAKEADSSVDVDLTVLSSTMVYAEVFTMMTEPESYEGKTIKMAGTTATYEDTETGKIYYACIVQDATACCSQGLEFVLDESRYATEDYPAEDDEITIKGTFSAYNEGENMYITMLDSVIE